MGTCHLLFEEPSFYAGSVYIQEAEEDLVPDNFTENFRALKFQAALRALSDYIPTGWKWELTLWQDGGGEFVKINPKGEHRVKRPSVPIKATVLLEQQKVGDVDGECRT